MASVARAQIILCFSAQLWMFWMSSVDGFGVNYWRMKEKLKEQRVRQVLKQLNCTDISTCPQARVPASHVEQRLDHFDAQNERTFQQRYWVNTQFWSRSDGPVFLFIGGEDAMSSDYVIVGAHVDNAKKYGALVFAVEHRFYGESMNADRLKLTNLKFLTTQQALADLAHFHQVVSASYNLTRANKWIVFGGSYAGELSAWLRIKYPHLIHASVASSAPVRAVVDFTGYNDVVTRSLGNSAVGGSQQCVTAVRGAFQTIDDMLKEGKNDKLARDFNTCTNLTSEQDVALFVNNLAERFQTAVQYDSPRLFSGVHVVCPAMTISDDFYQNLRRLIGLSSLFRCERTSWTEYIAQLSDDRLSNNMRAWTYQTCAQFGFYQTCESNTSCVFSRHITLQPNLDICRQVFNISSTVVYDQIDFTNAYYGSTDPQGSRVLFVNGLIDPWHSLSVLTNISSTELAIVIPDSSHCADMFHTGYESPALQEAVKKISEKIGEWITD